MASARRVGELHVLSVSQECLQWHPGNTGVTLWPNPSFLPKTLASSYVNLGLAAFQPAASEPIAEPLCPARALRLYLERTAEFRWSDSLFICHTGCRQGHTLSKQHVSKWIVETIVHAYETSGSPAPPHIRAHSTKSVSTSWTALRGVPISDFCAAASWTSACTFTRFYRINVVPHNRVATAILSTTSQLP